MPYFIAVWHHRHRLVWRVRHEWIFRLRFVQDPVAQRDFVPTLAGFASIFVISRPPRFGRDYSADARLVIFAETHGLRASDGERDHGVFQKSSVHTIRESRIATSPGSPPKVFDRPALAARAASIDFGRGRQPPVRCGRRRSRQHFCSGKLIKGDGITPS